MASFESKLARGKVSESALARFLIRHNWLVVPAYDVSNNSFKGPAARWQNEPLVLPDILAAKGGTARWCESKDKSGFTWYRTGHCWETGIDLRHCHDYQRVSELSGWPVFLFVVQGQGKTLGSEYATEPQPQAGVYYDTLEHLAKVTSHTYDGLTGKTPMIYWRPAAFGHFLPLAEFLGEPAPAEASLEAFIGV